MRIGIPQALFFYKYLPFWQTLLREMGFEVLVSPPTNKHVLKMGVEVAENELCLPVKVFYGHCLDLKDKVDALLIPRIVSIEKDAFTCPKFLGIPDMIRALDGIPTVFSPTINRKKGRFNTYLSVLELAKKLGVNKRKATLAFTKAKVVQRRYERSLLAGSLPIYWGKQLRLSQEGIPIGVVSHAYNVYDYYINLNLLERLSKMGAKVVIPEMVSHQEIEKEVGELPKGLFWTYEKEVFGTVKRWLRTHEVTGIIYILSFCCGPDSMIQVLIEEEARKSEIPLMSIVIDEHSGEAGLVTRIEAFMDMIERKTKRDMIH